MAHRQAWWMLVHQESEGSLAAYLVGRLHLVSCSVPISRAQVVEGVGGCGMIIVNNEGTVSRMPYKTDEEVCERAFSAVR